MEAAPDALAVPEAPAAAVRIPFPALSPPVKVDERLNEALTAQPVGPEAIDGLLIAPRRVATDAFRKHRCPSVSRHRVFNPLRAAVRGLWF